MDFEEKRKLIRRESLNRRKRLSTSTREVFSKKICTHLIEWLKKQENLFENDSTNGVMVYLSMKSEVNTQTLVEYLLNIGKNVTAPVVDNEKGILIPRCIKNHSSDLVQHRLGMLEPNENCPVFPSTDLTQIIVPGIAFDMNGYRLGYGKGFYDRFLPSCPIAETIGLAFHTQLVENTYPQTWDIPMKYICTENGLLT
ncbi:5-formyltetrahydrofolate cyclo-ligase [Candidatus Poribacteria bacterium]|nr:5-formyltetrahydrofolate cyclo-ligase [Candidatus Poribacteria bacterium]